ncbi:hypothetical protein NET03_10030 [Thermomicrobium sp. CFH 73360]|uniref:hypothetical protein n=1 Tax=Thermomicrobium sp. CFH 73360 TaxID=2951987 RepID=UPI002076F4CA|nr:hypothetical protein [Thermomicrobium sp. CFH 73360]MCM8746860.1 hypothetical protein [Thermomicrobium sp. CFH 73360]
MGERVGDGVNVGVIVAGVARTTRQVVNAGVTGAVDAAGTVVVTLIVASEALDLVGVGGLPLGVTKKDEPAFGTTVRSPRGLAAVGEARFKSAAGPDIVEHAEPPHAVKPTR